MSHAFQLYPQPAYEMTAEDRAEEARERHAETVFKDYAAQLVKDDEVEQLVEELYDAASPILAALNAQQLATGRAPSYAVTTFMQRLRGIVKGVEGAA